MLGWRFAFRQFKHAATLQQEQAMSRSRAAQWMSHGALLLALLVSWEGVGSRLFEWLKAAVPQAGTDIHTLTVVTVMGMLCVGWIVIPSRVVREFGGGHD